MDPLTALSVAGNVIQFVDFSTKLLSQGYELYKSVGGKLKADEELELIASDLSGLVKKFQEANIQSSPPVCLATPTPGGNPVPVLQRICDEAIKIAGDLHIKLKKVQIDKSKNRYGETFKRVWMRLWSQKEIDEMVGRLSRLREVITSEAIAAIL